MATARQAGQNRWAKCWQSSLVTAAFGLSLTIVTGCSTTPTTAQQSFDPLHGHRSPPGVPAPPQNPPTTTTSISQPQPQAISSGSPLAIPTGPASTATAALAGTGWQNPAGNNASGPPFLPAQLTTNTKAAPASDVPLPNANPKVEPVPVLQSSPAPTTPTVTPISDWQAPARAQPAVQTANAPPSPDLARQLQDRGVLNQKQEQTPAGLHLTCYVSRGAGSGGVRILEVVAADYTSAAQAILRELDAAR